MVPASFFSSRIDSSSIHLPQVFQVEHFKKNNIWNNHLIVFFWRTSSSYIKICWRYLLQGSGRTWSLNRSLMMWPFNLPNWRRKPHPKTAKTIEKNNHVISGGCFFWPICSMVLTVIVNIAWVKTVVGSQAKPSVYNWDHLNMRSWFTTCLSRYKQPTN